MPLMLVEMRSIREQIRTAMIADMTAECPVLQSGSTGIRPPNGGLTMPFTDADGNPITCHTCPFKINTDCTAMPPTPSTNALTMQVWNYPASPQPLRAASRLGRLQVARRGDGSVRSTAGHRGGPEHNGRVDASRAG